MTIAKYSTSTFQVLDKAKILDGQDSWGPIAITGGYLLMRDSKTMVCIDVRAR
jgi:outer membrane protein assembly factor BamB